MESKKAWSAKVLSSIGGGGGEENKGLSGPGFGLAARHARSGLEDTERIYLAGDRPKMHAWAIVYGHCGIIAINYWVYRNCAYRYVDSINWVVEIITGNVSIIITCVHRPTNFRHRNCEIRPVFHSPRFETSNLKISPPMKRNRETTPAYDGYYVVPFLPSTKDGRGVITRTR